jgi:hypothetical protein
MSAVRETASMHAIRPAQPHLDPAPLDRELHAAVEQQLRSFLDGLLEEDLDSDGFRTRLDAAFRLGREEIAASAGLLQGRLLQRNFVGLDQSPAFAAIGALRERLDELAPGSSASLLAPRRLLGVIPFGRRIDQWLRRFRAAGPQLANALRGVYAARDDLEHDLAEVAATAARLTEADQRLAAATHFAERLDAEVSARLEALRASDAARAEALEQELLFYARQNRQDLLTQRAVGQHARLALDALRRTGRELVNGCTRVATTGISALAAAQTVAIATAGQARVADMLEGVGAALDQLIEQTGRELEAHVTRTTEFASRPLIALDKLAAAFERSFEAIAALDEFRSRALAVLDENNATLTAQIARSEAVLGRERLSRGAAARGDAGPVAL